MNSFPEQIPAVPDQTSDDILDFENYYERASTGKRLANYLIDIISFYIVVFLLAIVIAMISPSSLQLFTNEDAGSALLSRLVSLLLYAVYMSIVETVFNGKSLGKLITKTRAVNLDRSQISPGTAFGRGFGRAVPFNVFSAFGNPCNPWHDRWTNSMVVNEKKLIR